MERYKDLPDKIAEDLAYAYACYTLAGPALLPKKMVLVVLCSVLWNIDERESALRKAWRRMPVVVWGFEPPLVVYELGEDPRMQGRRELEYWREKAGGYMKSAKDLLAGIDQGLGELLDWVEGEGDEE